jgi:hypothetical protein
MEYEEYEQEVDEGWLETNAGFGALLTCIAALAVLLLKLHT